MELTKTLNISAHGACIASAHILRPDQTVHLTIPAPAPSTSSLVPSETPPIVARVLRQESIGEMSLFGLQFLRPLESVPAVSCLVFPFQPCNCFIVLAVARSSTPALPPAYSVSAAHGWPLPRPFGSGRRLRSRHTRGPRCPSAPRSLSRPPPQTNRRPQGPGTPPPHESLAGSLKPPAL